MTPARLLSRVRRPVTTAGLAALLFGCAVAAPPSAVPPLQPIAVAAETAAMQGALQSRLATIRLMACLSAKAYQPGPTDLQCPPALLADYAISPDMPVAIPGGGPEYRGHYVIATNRRTGGQVIAIRGTASREDAETDARIAKIWDDLLHVMVHSGFRSYAAAVYADAKPRLRLDRPIAVTGHSLGGAAALLVGLYIYADRPGPKDPPAVYTFGQPRVFDNEGVTSWPEFGRNVVRVVDCADPVPLVPTGDKIIDSIFRGTYLGNEGQTEYQHLGNSLLLMDDGQYWMPGTLDVFRSLRTDLHAAVADFFDKAQQDHSIGEYIARLQAFGPDGRTARPLNPATLPPSVCKAEAPVRS